MEKHHGGMTCSVQEDSITQAEFDTMMQTGLAQAKKNDSVSVDEAFNQLKSEI